GARVRASEAAGPVPPRHRARALLGAQAGGPSMIVASLRAASRLAWLLVGGMLLVCILFHPLGQPRSEQAVTGAAVVTALLAGWSCMWLPGRPGTGGPFRRAGWSAIGTGVFLLAISQGTALAFDLGTSRSPAAEACANVSYLAAYPAMLAGAIL